MILSLYTIISFLGLAGFILARHIHKKKEEKKHVMCPLKSDCDKVITSTYSKMGNIRLEVLGMWYYLAIFVTYAVLSLFPSVHSFAISFFTVIASTAAFMLSIYLIFVQAFALRAWCTWCLMSWGLSTIIFLLTLFAQGNDFLAIISASKETLQILHSWSIVLGVVVAIITDLFFFNFLKDKRISLREAHALHILSKILWVLLAVLFITTLYLYLPNQLSLDHSALFLVKIIGIIFIIVSTVVLHLVIGPRVIALSFGQSAGQNPRECIGLHRNSFILGTLLVGAWGNLFIFQSPEKSAVGFTSLFILYIAIMLVAFLISKKIERRLSNRSSKVKVGE